MLYEVITVEDNARSVYSGLVHLLPDADKAKAYQTNRNLVLTEGASAESIPNLIIEANDRITSYNVCYTKLLRNGRYLQPHL